jgi:hypothetical protein
MTYAFPLKILDDADESFDAPTPPVGEKYLYMEALENVRAILVGASEDVQDILGEDSGGGD